MKIMQVTVEVARVEAASAEVLVLLHCEGEALVKQDTARLDTALDGALSTLVHELTHVWQHDYLDTDAMQRLAGLRLIEGHAQWASIECLRQLNLAPDFCASEAARSDVYGEGYREVVRMLQASGGTNAFAMLLGKFERRGMG